MLKNNIQMFGGRGASSSLKNNSTSIRAGLKAYFAPKNFSDKYRDVSFKLGKQEIVTDTYSMYFLNNTNLKNAENDSVIRLAKEFDKKIDNASNFTDINNYITNEKEIKIESNTINNNMYFNTKKIKQAKTILGKDTKASIIYDDIGRPQMIFKNKKGEKGLLLPLAKF